MEAPDSSIRHGSRGHFALVRRVLAAVLIANLAVTAVKIALGLRTGALAVIADGFHSLVDSSSNLIGLAAIRLAARPPDERHPYGYSRYETVGTLAIGGMLIVAAYEIGVAIVERLVSGASPQLTPLTFWLILLTLPVNLSIYLLERRAGRRLHSAVLLADAAHTRIDLFVTVSVIASMLAVQLGLPWFDLVIAAVVVVLIVRAAYGILRDAASTLTDRIVIDPDKVEQLALSVPGVRSVHRVRSRGAPGFGFVDLHVKVHAGLSTEQGHAIASAVERQVGSELPEVTDVLVHIEPASQMPTQLERIRYDLRRIADGMGLAFHDLHVHAEEDGAFTVELHLEMPQDISLHEAHVLADAFERRVAEQVSRPFRLIAHLEPVPDQVLHPDAETSPELRRAIELVIAEHAGNSRLGTIQTYRSGSGVGVAVVIGFPTGTSLTAAHTRTEAIERALRDSLPLIHRVTVHAEPMEPGP